jgi:hypothetical protein
MAFGTIGIALLAVAWNYSAREPALREPNSPWIPLSFSPDGEIIAAADSTGHQGSWMHEPRGPIHLLRATDLTPAGPPVETPTIDADGGRFIPPGGCRILAKWRVTRRPPTPPRPPTGRLVGTPPDPFAKGRGLEVNPNPLPL